jgi:hypothetical protein
VFGLEYERYAGGPQSARESQAEAIYRQFKGSKFDQGGFLPVGTSVAVNTTGHPEPVLTGSQWEAMTGGGDQVLLLKQIAKLLRGGTVVEIDRQPVATAVAAATLYGATP